MLQLFSHKNSFNSKVKITSHILTVKVPELDLAIHFLPPSHFAAFRSEVGKRVCVSCALYCLLTTSSPTGKLQSNPFGAKSGWQSSEVLA